MVNEKYEDYISQGISLMTEENYSAAMECFQKAIDINKKSLDAYIHLGNAQANLGMFDEAISSFKNALVLSPSSGEVLYSIGNIYLLKGENLKAIEYYNKAEDSGFHRADMYRLMSGMFLDAGDDTQSLRYITKAINEEPLDGNLRLYKARIYLASNRYNEALEALDEMQKILPDAFEVYDLRAQIYLALKEYDKALEVAEKGSERFPNDPNLTLSKLKVLVEMESDEAWELISSMKSTGQYDMVLKDAVIQESILYLRKHDAETTIGLLSKANETLNGDADILYLILDVYGKSENYEGIIRVSEDLINMNPGYFYESTARYFHAHALDKLGRKEEAKKEYKKLTSSLRKLTINDPSFYEGYIYRLLSHTRIGEYDQALQLAEYIENLYPERADSHTFRYFIYKEMGDEEKAQKEKTEAEKINPDIKL